MDNPSFFLEGVVRDKDELQNFEGPLSLILLLLSKNKIEIRDISISDILDQYLEYLDKMQSMDLEIASEFVQMAAHLLYIKTRTLLAGDEEVSELEVLMASLEQLKCRDIFASIQKVLPELKKASEIGMLYFSKMPEPLPPSSKEYAYRHEPVDLLIISLGTNDLKYGTVYRSAKGLDALLDVAVHANTYMPGSSPVYRDEPRILVISPIALHEELDRKFPGHEMNGKLDDSRKFAAV